jgi:hypothetical protein
MGLTPDGRPPKGEGGWVAGYVVVAGGGVLHMGLAPYIQACFTARLLCHSAAYASYSTCCSPWCEDHPLADRFRSQSPMCVPTLRST